MDINCDMGEGISLADCLSDNQLMPYITRCNIACGGHAGSEAIIRETILNAKRHKLSIGAHPGYEDKANFGRKSLDQSVERTVESVQKQLECFFEIARQCEVKVDHIKLHGALYNDIENSENSRSENELGRRLVKLFQSDYDQVLILGLAQGQLAHLCKNSGLIFFGEAFIDRRYLANGKLSPRNISGAVIQDAEQASAQALNLIEKKPIETLDGHSILIEAQTLCIHGDNPAALGILQAIQSRSKINH
ncbi:5-oxoprolinase subunit PxpA [Aliikangiella sp. G2MR2-5]|uniref:5-oxoprolinase subunit PxpA n=1 Tax=Aliikangiella sp. G2MR2-5 TaxID=2788943 RepID=UPI0018AB770B